MVLSIENAKADQPAWKPAELTGETITDAVVAALQACPDVERRRGRHGALHDIVERFSRLEALDRRGSDDILGYDQYGLPW